MTQRELSQFSITLYGSDSEIITQLTCSYPSTLDDYQLRKLINDNVSYLINAYSNEEIVRVVTECDRYKK